MARPFCRDVSRPTTKTKPGLVKTFTLRGEPTCEYANTAMPNGQQQDFGVMRFLPYEMFQDPARGLGREARRDRLRDLIPEGLDGRPRSLPQGIGDWPRVHTAIC